MHHWATQVLLLLTLCFSAYSNPSKYCLESGAEHPVFIISVNIDGPRSVEYLHREFQKERRIEIKRKNEDPQTQFIARKMEVGDCFLAHPREQTRIHAKIPKKAGFFKGLGRLVGLVSKYEELAVVPVVIFRKRDGSRHFGFVESNWLSKLKKLEQNETSVARLLGHKSSLRDLTILYVICPPNRATPCSLSIKQNGRWVKDSKTKRKLTLPVLGQSREKGEKSFRALFGGDTPQGIYYIWGSLFTKDPAFGNEPRIDLDSMIAPINSLPYELHRPMLDHLVPKSALDDYWIHEWPLAYKLGRINLRIHTNPQKENSEKEHMVEEFRKTQGCLNAGPHMGHLISTLIKINVLSKEQVATPDPIDSPTLGWRVSPRLGKTFLIVKDKESKPL